MLILSDNLIQKKMGDGYSVIVPQNIKKSDINWLSDQVIHYLSTRRIIKLSKKENVFSRENNNLGYEPDINSSQVIKMDENDPSTVYVIKGGLVVEIGRQSFYTTFVESLQCPSCKLNIWETDLALNVITEWEEETGKDIITCDNCGKTTSITEYIFEPRTSWAFGEMGFSFWNWGEFRPSFIDELETLIGYKIAVVYGKL